jgi:hypothetical protein
MGAVSALSNRTSNRTLAVALCGLALAACTSMEALKPKPTTTLLLIESNPGGAEARTSLGGTCHTPCTMQIGSPNDFTVTFTLAGYEPQTLTVHSVMEGGSYMTPAAPVFTPAPLIATLQSLTPPAKKPPPRRPTAAAAPAPQ